VVETRVSVIIPGRCEPYFQQTVDSALERATGDVEIVAIVDGPGQEPPVASRDPRVKIIELDTSIGQRAAYNLGVRASSGEFVMKVDAHALMSVGYDETLKAHCPPKTVVLPEMRRLDVEAWKAKGRGKTHFMFFGLDLYCHYWRDYRKRPEAQAEYPEVMTGQGSCWFTRREWNDHIGLLDEGVGSWGNVGIEVSLRTWLCGGSQIVNKRAWQAHWFRRDDGGFTYPMDGRKVAKAHNYTRDNYYYKDDAFENQTRPFSWLIEKFAPVPGWEAYLVDEFKAPRVIVYYTDSQLDERLAKAVRKQIKKACGPIPIISVSQKPIKDFGQNIVVGEKPKTYRSVYEQLLVGLEAAPAESIVYTCEHDVFYHPSHFAKLPESRNHAYFNSNRYHYRLGAHYFIEARDVRALSQCVVYREMLIEHCKERIEKWERGASHRMKIPYRSFSSSRPNVDIRHDQNLTKEGDYMRAYKRGELEGIGNLPGWGSPPHFERKTGYRVETSPRDDPAQHLHEKWRRRLPQPSPVRCPGFKRSSLPGLFAELGYVRGAEIGVMQGKFSEALCKGIPDLELRCVDLWGPYYHYSASSGERHYKEAQERLALYNAKLIKATSVDAAKDVADGSLDFVYIDADHRFDYVMLDLILWSRKVRPGGIVAGHDYYRFRNAGVVPAVDVYTHVHGIHEWFITDEKEASFFWVKSDERGTEG